MKRQIVKRLMAKGIMVYIAVFSLVLMVAMPALAVMANSVGSLEIIDHSIKSVDIRNKAVTTDRIAPRAVLRGKIGKRAIRTEHVKYLSDSKIRYSTKTKKLSIVGAAFRPEQSGDGFTVYLGGAIRGTGAGIKYFTTPVNLPDGATITKLTLNAYDAQLTYNAKAELRRTIPSSVDNLMADVLSSGNPGIVKEYHETTILNPVVDNSNFYYVRASHDASAGGLLRVVGVIITYKVKSP